MLTILALFVFTVPFVSVPFCVYELKPLVSALKKASTLYEHYMMVIKFSSAWKHFWKNGKITQSSVVREIAKARDIRIGKIPGHYEILKGFSAQLVHNEGDSFYTLKPKNRSSKYIKVKFTPREPAAGDPHNVKLPLGLIRIDKTRRDNATTPEQAKRMLDNALNTALAEYYDELAIKMMKPKSPEEELVVAVECQNKARVRELINSGVSVDAVGPDGWSPLIMASAQGLEDIARYLLEKGANPNSANNLGRTALLFAARYGNQVMVKLLLRFSADVDIPDLEGNTPLIMAARFGHNQVVTLLLHHNANGLATNLKKRTAEEEARRSKHGTTARIIRERGKVPTRDL